ncbi:Conserved membrane protein of uncharacterised function [Mycobacteroides abscessus]|nr:Conserved membrane protein of uncharacterised function [Mycobacteroides abscessus]
MIGIVALAIGVVLGLVFHPNVPDAVAPYLPIAVVAALDASSAARGPTWTRYSIRRSLWCPSCSTSW